MAVLLDNNGALLYGGWLGVTSGGTYCALVYRSGSGIAAYTDIFGTPTLIGSVQSPTTVHGGGSISRFDAYMDSTDVIHVISFTSTNETRDLAYNTISDPDGTPAWGTWEEAAAHDEAPVGGEGVSIVVDSNDAPHVAFLRGVKDKGTIYVQVYYVEKTGASWSTPAAICGVVNNNYSQPRLTIEASDELEAVYTNTSNGDVYFNSTSGGSWGTESSYSDTGPWMGIPAIVATTGGIVYMAYGHGGGDIYESNVDTTYNHSTASGVHVVSVVLINDADRYVFYIDTSSDIHLMVSASGTPGDFTDLGAIKAGTFDDGVIASWQYLNDNLVDEIIYMYQDTLNDVYVETYSLAQKRVFITHV